MRKIIFYILTCVIIISYVHGEENSIYNEMEEIQNALLQLQTIIDRRIEELRIIDGQNLNEASVSEDLIEVFRFDSTVITNILNIDLDNFELPGIDNYLILTDRRLFEYNYSIISSTNPQLNRHNVIIVENSRNPFYSHLGESGGGHTYAFFYFFEDSIIMRFESVQYYGVSGRQEINFETTFIRDWNDEN